ncbi:hypothetical protein Hamer_G026314 [Homarus americanus]|uniref:Uncharacterized protein n=1 Tax=Homarus americanus TaxID=6706 RepID=A0A8J5JC26_HOMAM|nr:hypothetical protein Hamer_G026314 [Homarus americanus]
MTATHSLHPAGSVMTATHCYTPSWICHGCHSLLHPKLMLLPLTVTPSAGSVMTATHCYTPSWICHDCHSPVTP